MSLWENIKPFVLGGTSGVVATSCIQPIDMIKVTIQIKAEEIASLKKSGKDHSHLSANPGKVIKGIIADSGIKGFYKGIDSAITRQVFYGTARLGGYRFLFDYIKNKNGGSISFGEKTICSLTAGFFASYVGNPADLALVRMQNDVSLPANERRNYKHVFDAFNRIIKEEGLFSLWRGSVPTICRAMSMNLGMLGPFDETKEFLNRLTNTKDTLSTRLIASCVGGFLGAFCSLPFDNAKTKIQKMKPDVKGVMPYKNIGDCMIKTISNEGVTGLWVGFPVFYTRVAPHAIISLMTLEFLTDFFATKKTSN